MSASRQAAVPNNAALAHKVNEKDLNKEKKALDHVAIDAAPVTVNGGVHLGPGKEQADFGAQDVARRAAIGEQRENAVHSSTRTSSAVGATARGGNHIVESGMSGEVSVQSTVSIETAQESNLKAPQQIQSLLSRLSSTTKQIDDYSRRQNEAISKEANDRVQRIIADTQLAQDALLKDASSRAMEIEGEYAAKLKEFLQGLDASKAGNLASLEKDLNFRQEQLLNAARDDMDAIHAAATSAKIQAMNAANMAVSQDVDRLTDQVKAIGEAEVERRMNSTTTTVITTETHAEGHTSSVSPRPPVVVNERVVAERDVVQNGRVVVSERDVVSDKTFVESRPGVAGDRVLNDRSVLVNDRLVNDRLVNDRLVNDRVVTDRSVVVSDPLLNDRAVVGDRVIKERDVLINEEVVDGRVVSSERDVIVDKTVVESITNAELRNAPVGERRM